MDKSVFFPKRPMIVLLVFVVCVVGLLTVQVRDQVLLVSQAREKAAHRWAGRNEYRQRVVDYMFKHCVYEAEEANTPILFDDCALEYGSQEMLDLIKIEVAKVPKPEAPLVWLGY